MCSERCESTLLLSLDKVPHSQGALLPCIPNSASTAGLICFDCPLQQKNITPTVVWLVSQLCKPVLYLKGAQ